MAKHYVVSDGTLMLILEPAEEGGYNVSSPIDPQLFTQAETLEDAFANAYDLQKLLKKSRAELAKKYGPAARPKAKTVEETPPSDEGPGKSSEAAPASPSLRRRRVLT